MEEEDGGVYFEPYNSDELRSAKEGLARRRTELAGALEAAARGMNGLNQRLKRRAARKYGVGILGEDGGQQQRCR